MKKTLKHLLPALFLAAVMALLTGCTKSVDLLQYADVTFDGASGNATATVTRYYNGLGKELFSKGKDQDIWDEAQTELSLMGHVNYTVTPQTGLSNGDTVTLTVSADDTFLKNHEITLSETSKTLTVSGLKEPETIDPRLRPAPGCHGLQRPARRRPSFGADLFRRDRKPRGRLCPGRCRHHHGHAQVQQRLHQ